jgi:superfamily II DNA helicase RecQ
MVNENLVGRCGLYCGACIIYRAYKDSEHLRQIIAEDNNCRLEEIRCEGCQTVLTNGWKVEEKWGKNCKIVMCLENKGLNFCYECDTYPECAKFHEIADEELKRGENLMENLNKIKIGKVKEWLEEEDKKWRCQKCGKPIAMHLTECHWCGAKLREKL